MRIGRMLAVAGSLTLALVAAACGGPEPTATPRPTATPTPEPPPVLALVDGWYQGQAVEYYDFGTNSPSTGGAVATAPIWAFITGFDADGNPQFVAGQHNVVDHVPGEAGYSDLWRVMLVTVPEGYVADTIRSKADLDASGYPVQATDLLVNCPIVPEGTTLKGGEPLVQGWHDGEEVYYPDFGLNKPIAIPIWAFITGFDAQGNPLFVEGQRNVIDQVPADPGYSAFWDVHLVQVPAGYEANAITSRQGVVDSGYEVVQPGIVVNCPVVNPAAS